MSGLSAAAGRRRSLRLFALLVLVAFALNWRYLLEGFHLDDMLLINMIEQSPRPFSRWLGVWSNDRVAGFTTLWWADPDYQASLWRPLPSLAYEASLHLFGRWGFPLHAWSLLLHGTTAGLFYLFVQKVSKSHHGAFAAALIFVTCEDHSMGLGWVATMTDMMCVVLIAAALLGHVMWLRTRRPSALIASLVALSLSFTCKETAVLAPVFLVLLTALLPRGEVESESFDAKAYWQRARGASKDWLSWLPPIGLLAAYLGVYKGFGLARMHNLMYFDPLSAPGAYLEHAVTNLPVLWLASLTPVSSSLAIFSPALLVPMAIAGLLLAVVVAWLLAPLLRNPLGLWSAAAYLLALLPQLGADASERALFLPMLVLSPLLALALLRIGFIARRLFPEAAKPARRLQLAGWYVLTTILLPGVILSAAMPFAYVKSLRAAEDHALTALPAIEGRVPTPKHVLMLNTSGAFDTFYMGAMLQFHRRKELDVRVLSSCAAVVVVERTGPQSFVLRVDRAGWIDNMFARAVRTQPQLDTKRRYDEALFVAQPLELTADGRDVLAVRFDIDRPLEDPSLLLLYWDGSAFRQLDLASLQEGTPRVLADTSDVFAGMM